MIAVFDVNTIIQLHEYNIHVQYSPGYKDKVSIVLGG